ncbi:MAG: hypothetical protein OEY52_02880 [Gammaproteobacteria bacterium]|nr:hypothetical protein [Gammaproteobacteria bacterium]
MQISRIIIPAVAILALSACGNGDSGPESNPDYELNQADIDKSFRDADETSVMFIEKCASNYHLPPTTANILRENEIAVTRSGCAIKTGRFFFSASECSNKDRRINLHLIAGNDFLKAINLGFNPISYIGSQDSDLGLELISCDRPDMSTTHNLVFVSSGKIQCDENSGQSKETTAQKLVDNGIAVANSQCGYLTQVAFPAVCFIAGTGDINIHTIKNEDTEKAYDLGYRPVSELQTGQESGYAISDCPAGS